MLVVISKLLTTVVALVLCTTAAGSADCPTISVACPDGRDTIQFTATVSLDDPNSKLTYQWTVTRGEIKSGQGTSKITVAADRNGKGLGAAVEVLGLATNCANTASCHVSHF
jgi:hypothetical protein